MYSNKLFFAISFPRYKKTDAPDPEVAEIAIDSTGLKRFGRGEWHQEKYRLFAKRSWRKLHIAVDDSHIIYASTLTDRFSVDSDSVETLIAQIDIPVSQLMADGAYDQYSTHEKLSDYFPNAESIIPPDSNSVYSKENHTERNRNLQEIKIFGRMNWQRVRNYGHRNYSELTMLRYKKIIGNRLHAIEFSRQKNKAMIGCGILNKMTQLGMPTSYRVVWF